MEQNKRKVIKIDGEYHLLKLNYNKEFPCWNKYGEKKSLKSISDLLRTKKFELEISDGIKKEIEEYKIKQSRKIFQNQKQFKQLNQFIEYE